MTWGFEVSFILLSLTKENHGLLSPNCSEKYSTVDSLQDLSREEWDPILSLQNRKVLDLLCEYSGSGLRVRVDYKGRD